MFIDISIKKEEDNQEAQQSTIKTYFKMDPHSQKSNFSNKKSMT